MNNKTKFFYGATSRSFTPPCVALAKVIKYWLKQQPEHQLNGMSERKLKFPLLFFEFHPLLLLLVHIPFYCMFLQWQMQVSCWCNLLPAMRMELCDIKSVLTGQSVKMISLCMAIWGWQYQDDSTHQTNKTLPCCFEGASRFPPIILHFCSTYISESKLSNYSI